MDTEKNQENQSTEKPKEVEAALETQTSEAKEEKKPAKRIRRQPTQEELDHPLHGVKLVTILEESVEFYGWEYLAKEVNILCFKHNPTIKVSLKFLRKFKWAREHVQDLYMDMVKEKAYIEKIENS